MVDAMAGEKSTEQKIFEAAREVFLRKGTARARMQDIADEAGVNKALLHYYFRSKERLAEAVFLRAARTLFPRMLQTLASDRPLREKLQRVVDLELDMLEENPYLPGYILSEFQHRHDELRALLKQVVPIDDMRDDVLDTLQQQLDAEAEAGRLRPTRAVDLMVTLIAQMIFPFAAAPMLDVALGLGEEERAAMVERRRDDLVDLILRSFAP